MGVDVAWVGVARGGMGSRVTGAGAGCAWR